MEELVQMCCDGMLKLEAEEATKNNVVLDGKFLQVTGWSVDWQRNHEDGIFSLYKHKVVMFSVMKDNSVSLFSIEAVFPMAKAITQDQCSCTMGVIINNNIYLENNWKNKNNYIAYPDVDPSTVSRIV